MQEDGKPPADPLPAPRPGPPAGAYGPSPDAAAESPAPAPAVPLRLWQRPSARRTALIAVFVAASVTMLVLLHRQIGMHGLLVGLALAVVPVPALIAVFRWIDRVEPNPWRNLSFAFAWGASAATLVSWLANNFAADWLATSVSSASARETDLWGAAFIAPVVEESAKACAILLLFLYRRSSFAGLVDGLVIAGITATGFAFTENILYLGTAFDSDRALGSDGTILTTAGTFFVRGILSPFAHPLFTAFTGIGFGLAAATAGHQRLRRRLFPAAGLLLAATLHGSWNGAATMSPLGFFAVYGLVMLPVFGLLVWLAVWSRGNELRTIREQLPAYTAAGWLSFAEPVALGSLRARKLARVLAARAHGPEGERAVAEYESRARALAFLRRRAGKGPVPADFAEREAELLQAMWERKAVAQPALVEAVLTVAPGAVFAAGAGYVAGAGYAAGPGGMALRKGPVAAKGKAVSVPPRWGPAALPPPEKSTNGHVHLQPSTPTPTSSSPWEATGSSPSSH